jgi:hypothetical protein
LLDVTDFQNLHELTNFLTDLVENNPPTQSPIGKILHDLTQAKEDIQKEKNRSGLLNIKISPTNLSCLYAFSSAIRGAQIEPQQLEVDETTKNTVSQLMDLSQLIRHACEAEAPPPALREALDLPRLREVHKLALIKLPSLERTIRKIVLQNKWI